MCCASCASSISSSPSQATPLHGSPSILLFLNVIAIHCRVIGECFILYLLFPSLLLLKIAGKLCLVVASVSSHDYLLHRGSPDPPRVAHWSLLHLLRHWLHSTNIATRPPVFRIIDGIRFVLDLDSLLWN